MAALGHVSASVASTLSINEVMPIRFGDFIVTAGAGDGIAVLDTTGARTITAGAGAALTGYNGANGTTAGIAGPSALETGSQGPGVYALSGANNNSNVYISFADSTGNPIDISGDTNYPSNKVTLTNGSDNFFVNAFTFNQSGADIYGHYITTTGSTATIKVGATLKTDAASVTYADGKYIGTFYVMASY